MKRKLTLNSMLRNNKLMIILSVVLALILWGNYRFANATNERSLTKALNTLDLTDTYAGKNGLQIYSLSSATADVRVKGSLLTIGKLEASDLEIKGDYSNIQGAGTWPVKLSATRAGKISDYEITGVYPPSVDIYCDYADQKTVKVEADVNGVVAAKESGVQLGTAVADSPSISDGQITINGPRAALNQISVVKARIDSPEIISKVTSFTATLIAYDENGNTVDTQFCTYEGMENKDNKVNVTVPVQVQRTVNFTYTLVNLPDAFQNDGNFVKISPASVVLIGAPDQIDSVAEAVSKLGSFDFSHMDLKSMTKTIDLNIPSGVRVSDGTKQVKLTFSTHGLSSKTVSLSLSSENTSVSGLPDGRSWTMSQQKASVTLVGAKASISRIKESDLRATVSAGNNVASGLGEYRALIQINGYSDVWVYYGETEPSGYPVYINVQ